MPARPAYYLLPPQSRSCHDWHHHGRANSVLDDWFRRHRRDRPGGPARPLADCGRPAIPSARRADRPAGRHRRTARGPAPARRTRPGRHLVREQEHRGRRLPAAARRGHGGKPPGRRHPHRPAPYDPGRGAPGQRILRRPARDLRARRGSQPGRGGLRAAGGGGAGRPGLRPGPGRAPGGDQHQRVLPARAAHAARRHRQPSDGPPRAACRPCAGDRHDRRPAGPGPAHPVRGAAWPAGGRRGSYLPRRARRAVPGAAPG